MVGILQEAGVGVKVETSFTDRSYLICLCGNNPDEDGFYAHPGYEDDLVCKRCYRSIDPGTLRVTGICFSFDPGEVTLASQAMERCED